MKPAWPRRLIELLCGLLALGAPAAGQAQAPVRASIGDLTIEGEVRTGSSFNLNYGRVKQSTAGFRVLHKGKALRAPDERGGSSELVFWEAWTLPDAPRPAILAANRATYLITLDGGEPRVQLLRGAYSDNASWQWLDVNGQVGEPYKVYIRDRIDGPRELRGGTALAISGSLLLDVRTLQTQRMDLAGEYETLKQTNGYSAGEHPVIYYSAAARQVAALGTNQADTFAIGSTRNPPYAMVVLDLASNTQYAVPFDRNAVRFADQFEDATPQWAATFFEWRADAQGKLRLQPRKLAKPPPWLGRFRDLPRDSNDTTNARFLLMPAGDKMVAPLIAMIERELGGRQVPLVKDETAGSKIRMEVNGLPISIRQVDGDPGTSPAVEVSTDVPVTSKLVPGSSWKLEFSYEPDRIRATNQQLIKLGEHINRQLAQGRLQEYFAPISQ